MTKNDFPEHKAIGNAPPKTKMGTTLPEKNEKWPFPKEMENGNGLPGAEDEHNPDPSNSTTQQRGKTGRGHVARGSSFCYTPLSFIPFLFYWARDRNKLKREFRSLLEKRKKELREFWSLLGRGRIP